MAELAISARNLGKRYRLGRVAGGFGRARARLSGGDRNGEIWALRDVTFDITAGETTGIIGRNGAGKSTLLKLLARITEPSAGYADVVGRVGALLEVGTGFHLELTGRENVFLNGAILGMSRREVKAKFDEIVEFSGVSKHIDTPVKWYSSGMSIRLAFAVAAFLEPEILIVDEVLAVGDAEFQKRCLGRMGDVAHDGRTVLFVSHNMQAVRRLCGRAILLDQGLVVADGETESVVRGYLASIDSPDAGRRRWEDPAERPGDEFCHVVELRVLDDTGQTGTSFFSSRPIHVELELDLRSPDPAFIAGFDLGTLDGVVVFRSYTTDVDDHSAPRLVPGRNVLRCTIPVGLLNSGRYAVHLRILLHGTRWIVHQDDLLWFDVIADHGESLFLNEEARPGVVAPLFNWRVIADTADPNEDNASAATHGSRVSTNRS
jgi:lipopolysaccharide transport system ATP-binding protein